MFKILTRHWQQLEEAALREQDDLLLSLSLDTTAATRDSTHKPGNKKKAKKKRSLISATATRGGADALRGGVCATPLHAAKDDDDDLLGPPSMGSIDADQSVESVRTSLESARSNATNASTAPSPRAPHLPETEGEHEAGEKEEDEMEARGAGFDHGTSSLYNKDWHARAASDACSGREAAGGSGVESGGDDGGGEWLTAIPRAAGRRRATRSRSSRASSTSATTASTSTPAPTAKTTVTAALKATTTSASLLSPVFPEPAFDVSEAPLSGAPSRPPPGFAAHQASGLVRCDPPAPPAREDASAAPPPQDRATTVGSPFLAFPSHQQRQGTVLADPLRSLDGARLPSAQMLPWHPAGSCTGTSRAFAGHCDAAHPASGNPLRAAGELSETQRLQTAVQERDTQIHFMQVRTGEAGAQAGCEVCTLSSINLRMPGTLSSVGCLDYGIAQRG